MLVDRHDTIRAELRSKIDDLLALEVEVRVGTRYRAEELLRFMGYEGFDTTPLLAQATALEAGAR